MLEIRMADNFPLDKHIGKTYSFDPHKYVSYCFYSCKQQAEEENGEIALK